MRYITRFTLTILILAGLLLAGCGPDLSDSLKDKLSTAETTPAGPTLQATCSYIQADLMNNQLTITVHQDEYSQYADVVFDQPYQVKGLENTYVDLFASNMGEYSPYVFLLTDRGTVEYVDVLPAIFGEVVEFTGSGELPGLSDVVSFHSGIDSDGYNTAFGVTADGSEYDLNDAIYYAENPYEIPLDDEAAMAMLRSDPDLYDQVHTPGMKLMGGHGSQYIVDDNCTLIALGTNHEANFVQEFLYGVSAHGLIYAYDAVDDSWSPANLPARVYEDARANVDFSGLFMAFTGPNGDDFITLSDRAERLPIQMPPQFGYDPALLASLKNGLRLIVEPPQPDGSYGAPQEFTINRGELYLLDLGEQPVPPRVTAVWNDGAQDITAEWYAQREYKGSDLVQVQYISGFYPFEQ